MIPITGTLVSVIGCVGCTAGRSEEHTSELQSLTNLVCRLLLEKKNNTMTRFFPERLPTILAFRPFLHATVHFSPPFISSVLLPLLVIFSRSPLLYCFHI